MEHDFREAAWHFFPEQHALYVLGDSPGFSGSQFARLEQAGRVWCLRRWPRIFRKARLRSIHHTLVASRSNGFAGVPILTRDITSSTIVHLDGHLYDAQSWSAGRSLAPPSSWGNQSINRVQALSGTIIAAVAEALALFHQTATMPQAIPTSMLYPLTRQLREIEQLSVTAPRRKTVTLRSRDDAIAQRWFTLLPHAATLARHLLIAYPQQAKATTTACHGDLWAAHIYADGLEVRGFIDFESLHYGNPATDIAQLILHCNGWAERDAVVQPYYRHRPLTMAEEAILAAAAALDLIAEANWSLSALTASWCAPTAADAHRDNLVQLLPSLEAIIGDAERRLRPGG